MLQQVVTGLLLIAVGICLVFIILTNQEMIYSEANQKGCYPLG